MIKNNEVTLHDSEEETTTAAPVFVGFDEEVHFSWEMEDDSNLCTDEFEVRRLDEEWIEEEWQMHVTRSAKKTRQKKRLHCSDITPRQHGSTAFVPPPQKGKKKKTGQKVMNDLLKQVPPLPITLREYMPKKLISHKDDEEGDEEIQHVICAMIRVTEANEKKETKAMSEQGPNKTNSKKQDIEMGSDEENFPPKVSKGKINQVQHWITKQTAGEVRRDRTHQSISPLYQYFSLAKKTCLQKRIS